MKLLKPKYSYYIMIGILCQLLSLNSCSDVTDRHKSYLNEGETIYVGKLDSLYVKGGLNRLMIIGQNTYLRTGTSCSVTWSDEEGELREEIFDLKNIIEGDSTVILLEKMPEGDYEFDIQVFDDAGNKSIVTRCSGSSYGDKYIQTQSKMFAIELVVDDNEQTSITLSNSPMAVKTELSYKTKGNVTKTVIIAEGATQIKLLDWENNNNSKLSFKTYILPKDKQGFDTLQLEPIEQTAIQQFAKYNVDKSKIVSRSDLTEHDDYGTSHGAHGAKGLFDGDSNNQSWGKDRNVPGHMSFDLGARALISEVAIVGRGGYPGWDVVKFEIWGRESIDDGPGGDTGYFITEKSSSLNFETDAQKRQWKKVGNGWFKYSSPRTNPQQSNCVLTDVDHSFKPRYMMFRVMSVLTPDAVPVPDDKYFGEEGGFNVWDGGSGNRAFCIGEVDLKAIGIRYILE